eukprot:3627827-Rhodomonas_salina.1
MLERLEELKLAEAADVCDADIGYAMTSTDVAYAMPSTETGSRNDGGTMPVLRKGMMGTVKWDAASPLCGCRTHSSSTAIPIATMSTGTTMLSTDIGRFATRRPSDSFFGRAYYGHGPDEPPVLQYKCVVLQYTIVALQYKIVVLQYTRVVLQYAATADVGCAGGSKRGLRSAAS